jgi:hypothetical protein
MSRNLRGCAEWMWRGVVLSRSELPQSRSTHHNASRSLRAWHVVEAAGRGVEMGGMVGWG